MSTLMFGYSDAVISPSRRMSLEGFQMRHDSGPGNAGTLDDLMLKVLTLRVGTDAVVIITLDLCLMTTALADDLRSCVANKLNLNKSSVFLSLSHTHSGPVTQVYWDSECDELEKELNRHELKKYLNFLRYTVSSTAKESMAVLCECVAHTTNMKTFMGYNRRYKTLEDSSVKNIFKLWANQGVVPDRIIDPDIPILMLERVPDKKNDSYMRPVGYDRIVLFNPAYHPVVLGPHNKYVSRDYPGAACDSIESSLGDGTKAIFFVGACGDTHPWLSISQNPDQAGVVGKAIGYSVVAALAGKRRINADRLSISEEIVEGKSDQIVCQVIRLGDFCMVGVSAECFTELGLTLKKKSPFEQTFFCSITNGCIGYLPTRDSFSEGGYEVQDDNLGRLGLLETVGEVALASMMRLAANQGIGMKDER